MEILDEVFDLVQGLPVNLIIERQLKDFWLLFHLLILQSIDIIYWYDFETLWAPLVLILRPINRKQFFFRLYLRHSKHFNHSPKEAPWLKTCISIEQIWFKSSNYFLINMLSFEIWKTIFKTSVSAWMYGTPC